MIRALLAGVLALAFALGLPALAPAHPADSQLDPDHDGVQNPNDNCPDVNNGGQEDTDGDGAGDACDTDDDADGVADDTDNCRAISNPAQEDVDTDGQGDLCDADADADGFTNGADNCPRVANPSQEDADADGIGNPCDSTPTRPGGSDTTGPAPTGGGSASGGTDPGDVVPPRASIAVAATHALRALAYGLDIPVRCEEACGVRADLEIDGRTAKRLKLGPGDKPAVIGSGSGRLAAAGSTFVIVELNKTALKRISRVRATRPRLRVTVTDSADNRKVLYRRLALRR